MSEMADSASLKVTQVRSSIGQTDRQRQTLRALGLTRRGRSAVVKDSPETRGRLRVVAHLVQVES